MNREYSLTAKAVADDAMSAFQDAKALLRADAAPYLQHLELRKRQRLKEMQRNVTAEMFQRWRDATPQLGSGHRFALLGGHPRSGTTLLEQVLESHPEVVSAEETSVFHDEAYVPLRQGFAEGSALMLPVLEAAKGPALQSSRERYFRTIGLWLGSPVEKRLLIDKNHIAYRYDSSDTLRVFPEAKFLVALRDPRDVCLSCFMQTFFPVSEISSAYISLEETVKEYTTVMGIWRTLCALVKGCVHRVAL